MNGVLFKDDRANLTGLDLVHCVDLVKSFPTNIFLQNLASIQKRTSPIKFAHLAEESENRFDIEPFN